MKATIVIPNINGKGWLKDSIESVYAQTEQDFELIIVDNGSTDESLEQARSYCGRPNFTLIENGTNTGFSHAVNQGIARAKGVNTQSWQDASKQYATQQSDLQGRSWKEADKHLGRTVNRDIEAKRQSFEQPTMMSARQAQARTIQETREMMGRTD